jgi:hypothetical protein
MFMRVFSPLEMQRSYRARKSAVVDTEELVVTASGDGFRQGPLRTTRVGPNAGGVLGSR